MKYQNIGVFLFDGFADWEIAFLTPEINKSEKYILTTFSISGKPVKSSGGLLVIPDLSLDKLNSDEIGLLILPGGDAWEKESFKELFPLVEKLSLKSIPVAAICGATIFLAQNGYLNDIRHTSNDKDYLKTMAPDYSGESNYQPGLAFSDRNIITASGIAPIEFAREIFKVLNLYNEEDLKKWYQLFKHGVWAW